MCELNSFTMFGKFVAAADALPLEDQHEFFYVLAQYGCKGEVPEIKSTTVKALFMLAKEDIKNSVKAREKNKGGRPKTQKQGVSENENGGFSSSKTGGFETSKQGVSENENPLLINQTNTDQYKPNHSKKGKDKQTRTKKFVPPSPAEVENYANEWISCNPNHEGVFSASDAEQFVNFYASNGWKVGRNQMKDWKASVRTWHLRNERDRKPKGGVSDDIAAQFAEYD